MERLIKTNNMNNQFIPYEQALELKELGFNEECFGFYTLEGCYFPNTTELNSLSYACASPLYQQAFRWFREKYEIVGIVKFGTQEFTYNIYNNDAIGLLTKDSLDFNGTYEEAEIACLKKLIEIVKNK